MVRLRSHVVGSPPKFHGDRDILLYRVTAYGYQVIAAVLHVRYNRFLSAFLQLQAA